VVAVLTYHSIDSTGSPISVSPEEFRRHVAWLSSGRVRVVPLGDIPRMAPESEAIALTFDDAFVNFGELAAPMLRDHGLPATVFVVTEHAGRTNEWGGVAEAGIPTLPLLDWDALGTLAQAGIEIGAHTKHHPKLGLVSPDVITDEVVGSADAIEQHLGTRPTTFAYPYGSVSDRAATAVRDAFDVGCSTVLSAIGEDDDRAQLPRIDMFYLREPGRLESWGTPAFRRRLWLRAQARRVRQYVASARDVQ
jgi:peptidoglycan/xylan/chitin deacetylase (PgdA/CDA1 family)